MSSNGDGGLRARLRRALSSLLGTPERTVEDAPHGEKTAGGKASQPSANRPSRKSSAQSTSRRSTPATVVDVDEVGGAHLLETSAVLPHADQLWSEDESQGPPLDLVMGLDFGTSSTKIVIQSPAVGFAAAIPFDQLSDETCPYLLATILYEDSDGSPMLAPTPHAITKLKLGLMDGDPKSSERCVAYLGLCIQRARQRFLSTFARQLPKRSFRWALNLGIPSAGYDDEEMSERFRDVAEAAWTVSRRHELTDAETARGALRDLASPGDTDIAVDVIPEVAAEVVGYANSDERRDGLHVMFDVGAKTIDVCGFVLHRPDVDDSYSLLTAIVDVDHGTHCLHEARLHEIQSRGLQVALSLEDLADPLSPIPESIDEYLKSGSSPDGLYDWDDQFAEDCVRPLMETVMALRRSRDPNSPAHRDGLSVFLGGGGAEMTFYQSVLDKADERLRRATKSRLIPRRLPVPPTLVNEDVSEQDFARLAVAYGLSFDSFDIGTIQPPSQIDDIAPRAVANRPVMVDKDQV